MRQRILQLRKRIKEEKPLIHCITNPISIHDCANVVLAVGARPIMAEHPAEVTGITASAGALMLNLGNITDARIESMKRSMRTAMENKIPVLLDLVGVACSDLRLDLATGAFEHRPCGSAEGKYVRASGCFRAAVSCDRNRCGCRRML